MRVRETCTQTLEAKASRVITEQAEKDRQENGQVFWDRTNSEELVQERASERATRVQRTSACVGWRLKLLPSFNSIPLCFIFRPLWCTFRLICSFLSTSSVSFSHYFHSLSLHAALERPALAVTLKRSACWKTTVLEGVKMICSASLILLLFIAPLLALLLFTSCAHIM